MQWITEQQATAFLSPNSQWEAFDNKDDLLKLATNRLEQLTFKGEAINRVGFRYIDGNSVSVEADTDSFLLEAEAGNFAHHETLGWIRGANRPDLDLVIYNPLPELLPDVFFDVPHDNGSGEYFYKFGLTFKQIQSLHSFGGKFGGRIVLDIGSTGSNGAFTAIETQQATGIVGKDGEQVFATYADRRVNAWFQHNDVNVRIQGHEGTETVEFDGTTSVDVIDEQGNAQSNTVPLIVPGQVFEYTFEVIDGLDNRMYLTVDGILVGNPEFARNTGGKDGNRLFYTSGTTGSQTTRHTYIRFFGSTINVENPITIPVRLVGACALLANQYGSFPPETVGNNEYLENENDYNRMQDLPINVQAAVEPFLADYESVIVDGVATSNVRGEILTQSEIDNIKHSRDIIPVKITALEYD